MGVIAMRVCLVAMPRPRCPRARGAALREKSAQSSRSAGRGGNDANLEKRRCCRAHGQADCPRPAMELTAAAISDRRCATLSNRFSLPSPTR